MIRLLSSLIFRKRASQIRGGWEARADYPQIHLSIGNLDRGFRVFFFGVPRRKMLSKLPNLSVKAFEKILGNFLLLDQSSEFAFVGLQEFFRIN